MHSLPFENRNQSSFLKTSIYFTLISLYRTEKKQSNLKHELKIIKNALIIFQIDWFKMFLCRDSNKIVKFFEKALY